MELVLLDVDVVCCFKETCLDSSLAFFMVHWLGEQRFLILKKQTCRLACFPIFKGSLVS
ncbi:hypothetical protein Hanom_Chr03g00206161 [Helianthus anomalus]